MYWKSFRHVKKIVNNRSKSKRRPILSETQLPRPSVVMSAKYNLQIHLQGTDPSLLLRFPNTNRKKETHFDVL